MAEKASTRTPLEDRIPSEARQHMRAARDEVRAGIRAMLPPEFAAHGRKARKEMLLAWRGLIDAALKRMEEREEDTA